MTKWRMTVTALVAMPDGSRAIRLSTEGPAADANLRVGDLIIEADGKEVRSVKEFEAVIGKMKAGKVLRLLIQRRATLLYTTVTLE
mgnify:CR=1 FL=1